MATRVASASAVAVSVAGVWVEGVGEGGGAGAEQAEEAEREGRRSGGPLFDVISRFSNVRVAFRRKFKCFRH